MVSPSRVAVVQNVIPQYREDMYMRLFDYYGDSLHVYCQSSIPGMNLNVVHDKFGNHISLVKTLSLSKEKLAWQLLPIIKLYKKYDVIFFYGNPRVLSSVVWASLFKLLGKKVVIWGQYHTAGANSRMEKIRLFWWSMFDYLFLYTEYEAQQYKRRFPGTKAAIGMNNGLNQQEIEDASQAVKDRGLGSWKENQGLTDKMLLLSCARLDKKNRYEFFIECLPALVELYPDLIWCVIGKGEEEERLRSKAQSLGVAKHIRWLGAIYNQEELAPWFLCSQLFVHPGSIGLSLMHAMGYGLPVVTHDNIEMQMPEIAALKNGENGILYRENDQESLIKTISKVLDDTNYARKLSEYSLETVRKYFNTQIMSQNFIALEKVIMGKA